MFSSNKKSSCYWIIRVRFQCDTTGMFTVKPEDLTNSCSQHGEEASGSLVLYLLLSVEDTLHSVHKIMILRITK